MTHLVITTNVSYDTLAGGVRKVREGPHVVPRGGVRPRAGAELLRPHRLVLRVRAVRPQQGEQQWWRAVVVRAIHIRASGALQCGCSVAGTS